jgi:hypothetical protein
MKRIKLIAELTPLVMTERARAPQKLLQARPAPWEAPGIAPGP